jgi:diacylglycerol kinase family enzyme
MTFGSLFPASTKDAGEGFAIVVNANAKRGGRRIAVQLARALPGASVKLTKSESEIATWLSTLKRPRAILAAGGDGSAVALLTSLRSVYGDHAKFPPVGMLPVGTGNAWAHVLGAQKLHHAVRSLARWDGELPLRTFYLLECENRLTFFAGSGWDAQMLHDYRAQLDLTHDKIAWLSKSVYGYLSALVTRTAPRAMFGKQTKVRIENLADDVYVLGENNLPQRSHLAGPGTLLYDGRLCVTGASTCQEFGFRFRAFPMAERMPGYMNVRVYDASAAEALASAPGLWRGASPMPGMTDFFSKHVRMKFSKPTPVQIAGDLIGEREQIDYKIFPSPIEAIDFRALALGPLTGRFAH